jgi:hypothetical protein
MIDNTDMTDAHKLVRWDNDPLWSRLQPRTLCLWHKALVSQVAQSVQSGYGLDDRMIDVRSPTEVRGFFV